MAFAEIFKPSWVGGPARIIDAASRDDLVPSLFADCDVGSHAWLLSDNVSYARLAVSCRATGPPQ